MQKRFWGYMIMLYAILGVIIFSLYIHIYYDVENYFLIEAILISYGILLPITIPLYIKSLRKYHKNKEKDDKKFSPVRNLLWVMFSPSLLTIFLSAPIIYIYNDLYGEDIQYQATVYERYKSSGRGKHYHVYVKSEYFDENLECSELYHNTQTNSEILIKKRISTLGSVVKYDDIVVLKY
ncbi:TPA: hypothetical protein ACU21B_001309 [Mannheimia haemolytica]|nr:hypothetical protein M3704_01880 [Mannheimia haemolytica]STY61739.1 Uncharacterised protein [Mannheimia haemolytica]